jgi:tricorn protease
VSKTSCLSSIALFITLASLLLSVSAIFASTERPLMRFPDVHEDTVVFVHGEDIWSVPTTGGVATRLTIHDGAERFPKFSNDGELIAFTGEYDGNSDIYVMNPHGGDITRVTYHPGDDDMVGWHSTRNKIIFRSGRDSFSRFTKLFMISPDGTGLEALILNEAATGSFSADGTKIAFNRVAREFRTWKRYRGGNAQEIYLYDLATDEMSNLTNFPGTDRTPMWVDHRIFFSSDRDDVLNLYSYDTHSTQITQHTHHTEYDVRRPSMGGDKIVYEWGGTLWLFDVDSNEPQQIQVEIQTDAPEVRPYLKPVDEFITGFACSPAGKRALVTARGEIFTIPRVNGPTRNLTRTSGAREKDATWSPDGKSIAYLSDESGEFEIHLIDSQGKEDAVQLTQHADGYRHTLRWSPDGKKIGFTDQTLRLFFIDVKTKNITEVDQAKYENVDVALDLKPIYDYNWSPDSRYIAYTKMNADLLYQVHVFALETGEIYSASNGLFNDFGPVFTTDGEHLLFISNRRFDPTYCDFEWEMVYKNAAGIYSLTLREDGPALLPFQSDEDTADEDAGKDAEPSPKMTIDFNELAERIEPIHQRNGNFRQLFVNDSRIFYLDREDGDFNRFEYRAIGPRTLYAFSLDDREEEAILEDVDDYKLCADGSEIIYMQGLELGMLSADSSAMGDYYGDEEADSDDQAVLDLSNMKMMLDPRAEWQQIFDEAWRMERDFYYEPEMHGLDWAAMREKYGRLVPHASCRQDMRYIIGELIGELNTSHTYVFGGDHKRQAEQLDIGMLGVDWEIDEAAKRYVMGKIYSVPDWTREVLPPLTRPGVNAKPGDYLLQVNGQDVTTDRNIYSYFQDLAQKQVTLLINDKPALSGAREVTVKPLGSEGILRYLDWVEHNRAVADKASNGQIGYLHLPDTYLGSAREFPKYFYSQTRKKGLIVDGRFNGGGLDPDIFLQRLDKDLLTYWTRRYSHHQTSPAVVTRAHMVCLTNRRAGSGGDMLPMEFQMRGMGPVIGTRTWGGLVGVSMWIPLIDGGGLSAPDYRIYDPDGNWVVENVGVQPDIVVDLHPAEVARGHDAQLMKGIEVLLEQIEAEPRPWPEHEPIP